MLYKEINQLIFFLTRKISTSASLHIRFCNATRNSCLEINFDIPEKHY